VSPHAQIDEGTIVMHHVLINAGARVGRNCTIPKPLWNMMPLEDYRHISTGQSNGGAPGAALSSEAVRIKGIHTLPLTVSFWQIACTEKAMNNTFIIASRRQP
jgi:hypothetical protein